MPTRKRARAEMERPESPQPPSLLSRLRNMWEFASIMQYIYLFGKPLKIDEDFDIDDLEDECLKPEPSHKLAEIGLCMLKFVSSHRGLTPELFDEYTRRQYLDKAPNRNPFGEEETPNKFAHFDVFTKLKVLFQLSQWTLTTTRRLIDKMPETKEHEQQQWRIDGIGYDKNDRLYFVFDDNRLYRRTDPAIPPPTPKKPKATSKAGRAAARASKRRKTAEQKDVGLEDESSVLEEDAPNTADGEKAFGEYKWECVAITMEDYKTFLKSMEKTRDEDEKDLRQHIIGHVMPIIEKREEEHQKKIARREKELINAQKMATAKRSSRLAEKHEREEHEAAAAAVEKRKQHDLAEAHKLVDRQKKMEDARESRMMTREQRLKEREYKRLLHEEELANLSEDNKKLEEGQGRISGRHLKSEMAKKQKELEELQQEEEGDWVFDCAKCGMYGENFDDGSLIIACERCNIWQHMACLGFSKEDAESNDFHFVCSDCKRKEEDAKRPKISLKLKLGASSSPISDRVEAPDALDQDIQAKKRKSSEILDHGIRTKKRKSSESNGLPPMGRFGVPQPNSKLTKGTPNNGHTYQSVMNPPSFPPQNQTSRPNFNGVSPGSQMYTSPYGNAYHQQASQMTNGYPANFPTSNGVHNGSHHESSNFGRTPQLPMGDSYTGYQANGLNGCSGGHSSLPNAAVAPSHPSDIKSSVKESTSPNPLNMFPSTPSTNLPPAPAAVTSVSGHSPQKPLQSSHSMSFQYSTPSNSFQGSSNSLQGTPSPNMAPPALGNQIFSGLSPSKQTPARPASSHSIGSVPVLPPVEKLAPSPRALSPILPMKGAPVQDMQATDEQKSSTTSDVPAMRASGDVVSHE